MLIANYSQKNNLDFVMLFTFFTACRNSNIILDLLNRHTQLD